MQIQIQTIDRRIVFIVINKVEGDGNTCLDGSESLLIENDSIGGEFSKNGLTDVDRHRDRPVFASSCDSS